MNDEPDEIGIIGTATTLAEYEYQHPPRKVSNIRIGFQVPDRAYLSAKDLKEKKDG